MRPRSEILVKVPGGVYEPAEDSYLLLDAFDPGPGEKVLEIGTGSGFIALHASAAGAATVVATDIDPRAVRCARANATRNGADLEVVLTDLAAGVRARFDVVVFNPPYLPAEPDLTDDPRDTGGELGDEVALRFIRCLPDLLAPTGRAYLLVSTLQPRERVLHAAEADFLVESTGRTGLFFEEIEAVRLLRKPPGAG